MIRKIAVAMSGGVDSSVAAALLKQSGEDVIGVTMRLWGEESDSASAVDSAREVCRIIGIEHKVLDLREIFRQEIIDYFLDSYVQARTPNPCVRCNQKIKFGTLMKLVDFANAEKLATGHYARTGLDSISGRHVLLQGADMRKDQSYFLYRLSQGQLAHAIFPLGDMYKSEVIETARKMGLPSAEREESQEVCFIPDNDYRGLIESERPDAVKEGEFVDKGGNVIGRHRGVAFYTEGQRRGLNFSSPGGRSYVINRDPETNRITLGAPEDLLKSEMFVKETNWISYSGIYGHLPCDVKLRHRFAPAGCMVYPEEGGVKVVFDTPTSGAVPGQSAVFYHGDTVLGGGIIVKR
jgi:tRNA-uridine 2-sulfurtransferase